MRRARVFVAVGLILVLGLLSALLSLHRAERRRVSAIGETWQARGIALTVLSTGQTASSPLDPHLGENGTERGPAARWLHRHTQTLPLVPWNAWVNVHCRVAGPFLVVTDSDVFVHHGRGAHALVERSLDVAFFGWSRTISSWATGASYSGTQSAN